MIFSQSLVFNVYLFLCFFIFVVAYSLVLFIHQCKTSMMEFSIAVANRDMVVQDRVGWRAGVLIEAKSYEGNRVQRAVENRQRLKCPTVDDSTAINYCRHCQKPCRSRIGCFSHERRCVPNSFSAADRRHRRMRPFIYSNLSVDIEAWRVCDLNMSHT